MSSSDISCDRIRISSSFFSYEILSSFEITSGKIRSTTARCITSRWISDGFFASFDISSVPGLALSLQASALRPLCLGFPNSLGQVLFADLCFRFRPLTDSKDLFICTVGGSSIPKNFHLEILGCQFYWIGVLRCSPVRWSGSSHFLYSILGSSCLKSIQNLQT